MPSSKSQPKTKPDPKLPFETTADCWINGMFVAKGSDVALTASDAKYLLLTGVIVSDEDDF